MKNIVIFASGNGTNAENIIHYFNTKSKLALISGIYCNKENAYVLDRAKKHNISTFTFNKEELENGTVLQKLIEKKTDFIVLAGFLLKFPTSIINHFPENVINIHPALLPKYGGKGMYGNHVHQAVLNNNELETGITIHYVNEHYDEGAIIFQAKTSIKDCTTAEQVAQKVHELEHIHFPNIIEQTIRNK